MAIYKVFCTDCGSKVTVDVYGEMIRETMVDPAEYPEIDLISRDCDIVGTPDNEFDDACGLDDEKVTDHAYQTVVWNRD
jgi:hypothetical protein